MTAENASRLSDAKRVLLERRLRGLSGAPVTGVRRRTGDGPAPLSPAQRGVWLADQLRADTSVSGVYRVMWLRGALDRDAFARAVAGLVERHEVLRTTYRPDGDDAVQVVETPGAAVLTVAAAPGSTPAERRAAALAEAEKAAAESFDLARGPLFTARLTETGADEHLLFLRMHHLLTDEWSCGLLARELAALYAAERDGRAHGLPALPVQYADYAAWLAEPAQAATRAEHAEWWTQALTGVPPVLELPTDRIRPDVPTYRGGIERLTLSPEASAGLRALAQAHGTTLFSALLALFGSVLHKYSGQARFAVGSLLSGRGRPEVENMMGMFASTVAIPLDFTGSPSFADVLERTGRSVVGALDHQDATVDQVVTGLRLPREPGRNPLFQALFQCVEVSEHEWDFAGLDVEAVWFDAGLAKVDLTLIAVNQPSGVTLELTYAEDLYAPAFATRLLAHLSNVVDAATASAGTRVADADMLTDGERHAALVEWNATGMDYPTEDTVHGLFTTWANEKPELPAIWRLDGTPVSYGELNAMSNRLAHYLREHGVGRETLVGVCAEHSVEMFVILLGVLKAGAAYVPLDASLPASRLEWILTDTAAPVVVTTEALRGSIPAFDGEILAVDTERAAIEAYPDHDPEPWSTSDNLLYTIYTSGSTGRPKGVLVPHRGVVNYLWWAIDGYGLAGERGAPMLGSIAFDLSVPNFWLPFIGGKCTTLLPTDKSLESLAARLSEPGDFSLLKITPGHLDVMRGMLEPGQVRSVRTFVVGADEVRAETVMGWRAIAPGARVINEYGPTETVVGCSIYEVPEDFDPSISVSIGKPIGNLRMYVLDAGLNPAPVGVVGELYIGGDGVARGYLNRPELTAAKFVPDPYGAPGDRLYRTGDLARYRADGDFEFLGRTDFQVKVRGYRIELGEVEARLGLHPAVTEAVAAVITGHGGHKRLAGYVVCDGEAPSTSDLKAFMAEALPEYMVPQVFVVLDAMPLTSAGKVDRTALPAPGAVRREAVKPATPQEKALAEIWAKVLGVPNVGSGDNFFELGGDSILAIKVVGLAREAGLAISPAALFRHQTIGDLAATVPVVADDLPPAPPIPTDLPPDANLFADAVSHVSAIGSARATATRGLAEALGVSVDEVLLAALARAGLDLWGGVALAVEVAGKPVVLRPQGQGPAALIGAIAAQAKGPRAADAQVHFGPTPTGTREEARKHLLDVSPEAHDGGFRITWTYGGGCHDASTIEKLAECFASVLADLTGELPRLDGVDLTGVADVYRLGPLQTGMLYQTAAQPDRHDYIEQFAYSLDGPLDAVALRAAWDAAVARHASLRTSFAWRELPYPVQLVRAEAAPQWIEADWTGADVPAMLDASRRRPLPLDGPPPVEFTLARLGEDRHLLAWRFHHIVLDGWSLGIVLNEVLADYRAAVTGDPVPVRDAPAPFRAFVTRLAARDPEADAAYWRQTLGGADLPTPIPVVGPEQEEGGATGVIDAELSREASERLTSFARDSRVTVGAVLHAAWGLLLAKDSGRADVVFGSTTAGRASGVPGIDGMVGLLMNTVPFRVTVTDTPVAEWLRDVHTSLGELRDHEQVPLGEVRRAAGIPLGSGVFDSIFVYENFPVPDDGEIGGLRVDLAYSYGQSGYPLVLGAGLHDVLMLRLNYDTERVTAADARRMLDAYLALVEALPTASLKDLAPTTVARPRAVAAAPVAVPQVAHVAPRTETERALAEVWREVLGIDSTIGVHDDFVVLGGDSILAMQVIARARDLGMTLRPRDLARTPTIAALAAKAAETAAPATVHSGGLDLAVLGGRHPGAESVYKLTPLQTGMLFHALGGEGGNDYVQVFAYDVAAPLDAEAFRAAWQAATDRHPALRTVFAWEDLAHPVQAILHGTAVDLRVLDWSDVPAGEAAERLAALAAAEQAGPVDLSLAPPTRVTVVRKSPDTWSFVWRSHHIALDGFSAGRVCDEVLADYLARAAGGEPPVVTPAPYEEYLSWMGGHDRGGEDAHWRAALSGFTRPTPLPAGTGEGEGFAAVQNTAAPELSAAIDALARGHRVTVGAVLHAAWGLYLARRTGREDVVFGTAVTGRSAPVTGADQMVGMLMNTLPVRMAAPDDTTVGEWLLATHRELGELREYEHCSLVDIQRATSVPAGRRLFESILVYQAVREGEGGLPGGFSARTGEEAVATDYPVVLDALWDGELNLQLNYERARFTRDEATAITEGFLALLASLAADPGASPARAARVLPAGSSAAEVAADDEAVGHVEPRGPVEEALAAIWAQILGVERVGAADDFYELGGDSILAIQVVGAARKAGYGITTKHILTHRTVAGLGVVATRPEAARDAVVDSVPLPRERWAALAEALASPGAHHWQAVAEVGGNAAEVWRRLADRHDVLRSTIEWDAEDGPVRHLHAAPAAPGAALIPEARLATWLAVERTRGLDPARSPQRVDVIDTGDRNLLVWQFSGVLLDREEAEAILREGFGTPGVLTLAETPVRAPRTATGPARPEAVRILTGVCAGLDLTADALLIAARATRAGAAVTVADVLDHPTIEGLAAVARVTASEVDEPGHGPVEPTPVHRWFARLDVPHDHYNQASLLSIDGETDPERLERALHAVVAHHDALRLRLTAEGEHVAETETARLIRVAAPGEDPEALATEANASLSLVDGPILRGVLFPETNRLLLAVHHIAVDIVSWGPLLEDLEAAHDGRALPEPTTSFRRWASRLAEYARGPEFAAEARYWRTRPVPDAPLPLDLASGPNTEGSTEQHVAFLDATATAALKSRMNEALVTALASAVRDWTGRDDVRLDLEGHGREDLFDDVDLSRTIGWFTAVRPIELRVPGDLADAAAVVRAKLREITGIGHGLAVDGFDGGEIIVNYHGQRGSGGAKGRFTPVDGPVGVTRAPEGVRQYLLEVDAGIEDDRLYVIWKYSRQRHTAATVAKLAAAVIERLTALAGTTRRAALPGDLAYEGSPVVSVPMDRHGVPGVAAAVLRDGELAGTWAAGLAAEGVPVRPETAFPVGSGSKYVAALALLRLAQDGTLRLDDEADRHLSGWRVGAPVTVRQLMAHTAGLTVTGYDGYLPGEPLPSLLDVLEGRGATPAVRAEDRPGTRFRYSGSHYTVLQLLLEEVTGTPYARLARELVLDPLGMSGSGYQPGEAIGHDEHGTALPVRHFAELAAAGLWSTAADMARMLTEVHRGHTGSGSAFLSRESAAIFLDPAGTGTGGLLLGVGDVPGHRCLTLADPVRGSGLVILSNADAGRLALDEISDTVVTYIVGDEAHTGRM
ncbi:hypothetical protein Afil01_23340 [Actinorhabdospora filicis]|uniref:Carrier domain-containing protein n=1 Tax=Actinorhabdospora filicis TaxID=1785913 RepID=A0A9W6W2Y4_9ACTN|nr:non-ribosomal peptide synthetase [Actinorhabdospora filicis]GLZ77527.1 hypothetical protein Afil01_23340 [Actinorhabdospora filicis]